MTILRFIFVILLCIPVAYIALRLIVSLIDTTVTEAKRGSEPAGQGYERTDSRDMYDDISARAEARKAGRKSKQNRRTRSVRH